jgi:hypothetical protein
MKLSHKLNKTIKAKDHDFEEEVSLSDSSSASVRSHVPADNEDEESLSENASSGVEDRGSQYKESEDVSPRFNYASSFD